MHARNLNSEENSNDQIEILERKKKENDCPVFDSTFPTEFELNIHVYSVHEIENMICNKLMKLNETTSYVNAPLGRKSRTNFLDK